MAKLSADTIARLLNEQGSEADELSLDDIESFGDDKSIADMFGDIAKYRRMLKERITFINDDITKFVPFTRENLYLICAYSGQGKSTCAANISYPLWRQEKKILVISNEESRQDILLRIACLHVGYNFNDYKKGIMPKAQISECMALFKEISQYVKVIDVNYNNGITSTVEGVMKLLELIAEQDYSCVMIDYYQLIKRSAKDHKANSYNVLNDLRIWLGQYIKRANLPVVVFAQLHSIGKRNNKDLDNRIKHCPDIYEPSTVVLEMCPNFEDRTTDFIIHKDRFGMAGNKIKTLFDRGRFTKYDHDAVAKIQNAVVDDIQDKLGMEDEEDEG